ncbi:MAG: methylated-DNA--[protein]-cysteine S-methyltransferase [Bacteroidota bacterium]
METQDTINYDRIAKAIGFIRQNLKEQPSLEQVAESVHLSSYHFQRMFVEWAGVSPKQFLQYLNVQHAKAVLQKNSATLSEAAFETGLSGTGRLHDLFVKIEGMTPGEFKNGGEGLHINYSYAETPFGAVMLGSTTKGICHMAFAEHHDQAFDVLKHKFPKASMEQRVDLIQQNALHVFSHDWSKLDEIKLHLRGTDFQIKVWETLLKIPAGGLSTYGEIAKSISRPKASRAVGTAIGNNPIAYLIPCHRVIQSSGQIGQYHWGSDRKAAMLGWEAAKTNSSVDVN